MSAQYFFSPARPRAHLHYAPFHYAHYTYAKVPRNIFEERPEQRHHEVDQPRESNSPYVVSST